MAHHTTTDRPARRPPTLPPTGGPPADLVDRLAAAERTVDDLRTRVKQEREVGIAIGIVMAIGHLDEGDAHRLLLEASRRTCHSIEDVAHEVARTRVLPLTAPGGSAD